MLILKYSDGVQLREDIVLKVSSSGLLFSGKKTFSINGLKESELLTFEKLKSGISAEELTLVLENKKVERIIDLLDKHSFLQHLYLDYDDETIDSRQLKWLSLTTPSPEDELKLLNNKKVCILGCGGTGANIAMHLVRSGVKNIVLIDGATIDAPDMNRQLAFNLNDIGKVKVVVLEKYLHSIAIGVNITTFNSYIKDDEQLAGIIKGCDLVVSCADKPFGLIHQIVTNASLKLSIPILFGGVGFEEGTLGPLLKNKNAKRNYLREVSIATETWERDFSILKSSLCHTNSIISSLMGFQAYEFLRTNGNKEHVDKSFNYNFTTGQRTGAINWNEYNE